MHSVKFLTDRWFSTHTYQKKNVRQAIRQIKANAKKKTRETERITYLDIKSCNSNSTKYIYVVFYIFIYSIIFFCARMYNGFRVSEGGERGLKCPSFGQL